MKLSKSKLIKLTKEKLDFLGYREFPDTITGAQGLFVKKISEDIYLTLGLTISRYYDSMFTGSYYLSQTTTWSSVWGDVPQEAYVRIGHLLTHSERVALLNDTNISESLRDTWWDAFNQAELEAFFEAVTISEPRLLNQSELKVKVRNSVSLSEMRRLSNIVRQTIGHNSTNYCYHNIPEKPVDGIPVKWFMAAERVLNFNNGILNQNTVKRLGADAFRQELIANLS